MEGSGVAAARMAVRLWPDRSLKVGNDLLEAFFYLMHWLAWESDLSCLVLSCLVRSDEAYKVR